MKTNSSVSVIGLIAGVLSFGSGAAWAGEEVPAQVSFETYQAAIESFGVDSARASEIAGDIVTERMKRSADNTNPMARVPEDFLLQNPYE